MTATRPTDRHLHAAEALDVRPGHVVLEIGCGHGVALGLVGQRPAGAGWPPPS